MKNKFCFKFIAVVMLAISLATIPVLYFSEPVAAASKKKKAKSESLEESFERDLDELVKNFVKREIRRNLGY